MAKFEFGPFALILSSHRVLELIQFSLQNNQITANNLVILQFFGYMVIN